MLEEFPRARVGQDCQATVAGTAAAKIQRQQITGTNWNGYVFFGIKRASKPSAVAVTMCGQVLEQAIGTTRGQSRRRLHPDELMPARACRRRHRPRARAVTDLDPVAAGQGSRVERILNFYSRSRDRNRSLQQIRLAAGDRLRAFARVSLMRPQTEAFFRVHIALVQPNTARISEKACGISCRGPRIGQFLKCGPPPWRTRRAISVSGRRKSPS